MPDAIVVQDRSNSPQSKNEQQPPVRSARGLKILDNHRNQNGEVTQ